MQFNYTHKVRTFVFLSFLFILSTNIVAQVGIGNTDPKTTLDVNGALSLRESPTALRLINGENSNISLGAIPYSQYRIGGPTGSFFIDGMLPADAADGQIVRIINTTKHVMTIVHNNSVDKNKIICPLEKNLVVGRENSSVTLQYSKGLEKWTVFALGSEGINRITVYGTTDIARQNVPYAPLDGLEITFTPQNSIIYIVFNAFGTHGGANADFRLTSNGAEIPNSIIRGTNVGEFYRVSLPMFPFKVTPGVEVTITAQWSRDGGANRVIRNNALNNPNHGRFLTIID